MMLLWQVLRTEIWPVLQRIWMTLLQGGASQPGHPFWDSGRLHHRPREGRC